MKITRIAAHNNKFVIYEFDDGAKVYDDPDGGIATCVFPDGHKEDIYGYDDENPYDVYISTPDHWQKPEVMTQTELDELIEVMDLQTMDLE